MIFCDKPHHDMQEWNMHKLKQALTGVTLALIACGSLSLPAHAGPHGGGWRGGGGGGWHGGGGWYGGGDWGGWHGGWGWGGWGVGYYPGYIGWGWGYPMGGWGWGWGWGWGGGWGWGWPGYYAAGAAMGAAAASASYQAAPEVYNATGNNAPEDDSVYDKDLSTLLAPAPAQQQPGPQGNGQPAPQRPPASCPKGQVYNDLIESCDRP
ncbi:hypothetical protein AA15973_1594 [Komagataeibacter sucrofermentans DSM 15973]|nr:hypothetical protein AA15973_1594 [Komagataeibacter sucrofermentans DSM 15973]